MIVAGSDIAGERIPGFTLHDGCALLVDAGVTQMQASPAATRNAAAVAMRAKDLGTIEPGKLADLVLLTADPLADIHNTRKIDAVIVGGKLFRRPTSTPSPSGRGDGLAELRVRGFPSPSPSSDMLN